MAKQAKGLHYERERERERVRERGKRSVRVGEGLESRNVSVSGFGFSLDRCCRSFQIGNSRIAFETSDDRFGSGCWLEALKGFASHFVFLDRGLVLWLEEVLQIASTNGWKFPSMCDASSSRRSVSISTFVSEGGQTLKVSERCSNGKLFFVLIPSASSFEGWKRFLSICQAWIASVLAPPPPVPPLLPSPQPPMSFASVVKGPTLSSRGRCTGFREKGTPEIKVEKDGVQECLLFLESCVVFRFCSQDIIDWARFRRWANRNWGTALNAPLQKLDDELWLLFCDSKVKVDRILSLNRNKFGDVLILFDRWIPEAGRSKVLAGEKVEWTTIRGILIHLRSSDLFRQIGSSCGFFLAFETCSSLSSVRIKIKRTGILPESVLLIFEDKIFPVQVIPDLANPHVDSSVQSSTHNGTSTLSPLPSLRFGPSSDFEIGSSSSLVIPPPTRSSSPEFNPSERLPSLARSPDVVSGSVSGCMPPEDESSLPFQKTVTVTEMAGQSAFSPREESHFVGLRLDVKDNLWLVSSSSWERIIPLAKLALGLGPSGPLSSSSQGPLLISKDWALESPDSVTSRPNDAAFVLPVPSFRLADSVSHTSLDLVSDSSLAFGRDASPPFSERADDESG
ncbi:hypothetical protein LINPERHAP2_LOCUS39413 [Linum perenne]